MTLSRRGVLSAGLGLLVAGIGAAVPVSAAGASPATVPTATAPDPDQVVGAVYSQSNGKEANYLLTYRRDAFGRLSGPGKAGTGGRGTGAGLGSQGSVIVTEDRNHVLVVNAGSNTVSALTIGEDYSPTLLDAEFSGGVSPVSVAERDGIVYVINAGAAPSIQGFKLDHHLGLIPDATMRRQLPAGSVAPGQIGFTPDGNWLVVTLKGSNQIVTIPVDRSGRLGDTVVSPSTGNTPFGFDFDAGGHLLVSNAEGGAEKASTVSSYQVDADGALRVITGAVKLLQSAACWLVTTPSGRYAYTTNTASSNVSSLRVSNGGGLSVITTVAAKTGAGPIDAGFTGDGGILYVLAGAGNAIDAYTLTPRTGGLRYLNTTSEQDPGMVGLAVL